MKNGITVQILKTLKEYKVVKSFTEKVVSNLAGIPLDEMKSDPRKGYECE